MCCYASAKAKRAFQKAHRANDVVEVWKEVFARGSQLETWYVGIPIPRPGWLRSPVPANHKYAPSDPRGIHVWLVSKGKRPPNQAIRCLARVRDLIAIEDDSFYAQSRGRTQAVFSKIFIPPKSYLSAWNYPYPLATKWEKEALCMEQREQRRLLKQLRSKSELAALKRKATKLERELAKLRSEIFNQEACRQQLVRVNHKVKTSKALLQEFASRNEAAKGTVEEVKKRLKLLGVDMRMSIPHPSTQRRSRMAKKTKGTTKKSNVKKSK